MNFRWANRALHIRWYIAAFCIGIVCGVWAAQFNDASMIAGTPWVLTGVLLCCIVLWKRIAWMIILAILAGFIIGVIRGGAMTGALSMYEELYGSAVTFEGVVSDDMDTNKRGESVLRLKSIVYNGYELEGMAWVVLSDKAPIERSDVVTVRGNLDKGFGTFAGTIYSAELIAIKRPDPGDVALHIRDWFAGYVRDILPEPEASLGIGFLVGQRRALPEDLANSLKIAGLMHIVVASGYNLTILVRIARRMLTNISKYLATVVPAVLMICFMAVAGASPSMSRAGLVAGLSLAAWYYGRTIHPVVLLAFAMAVTVFVNPSYIWGDIGWLLSFSAFAGVMIASPLLQAYYFGNKIPGLIRQVLGETIAAWLFTLPVLLVTFGVMSNVAVIANILIVPLIPLTMLATLIAGLIAWVLPVFAPLFALPAQILLSYMTQTAHWAASLDWAQREISVAWWQGVLLYGMLIAFCLYMRYKTKLSLDGSSIIE